MSEERGLVINGEIIPGTEWVRRDPDHWWTSGRGTRPRASTVDVLVGHWTAGEATSRRYDDDGPHVVRVMRSRKRKDGSPMNVGIAFVVGACSPEDEHANVWQCLDPGRVASVHVGHGPTNARSIGVEVVSAGLPGPLDARARPQVHVPLLGRMRRVLAFYPGQLASWVHLAETLAALDGRGGISLPRRVPSFGAARRWSRREQVRWSGAQEHLHVPSTRKIDAGGLLVDALRCAGWEPATP